MAWNVAWIAVAVAFTFVLGHVYGRQPATEYLTGYVVERALSIDNIFVFVVIFRYFGVEAQRQARVLFWGIIGALVMRAAFIVAGAALVDRFHWLMLVFGAFLVYTGVMLVAEGRRRAARPEQEPRRAARRHACFRSMRLADGEHFFVKSGGRWHGTHALRRAPRRRHDRFRVRARLAPRDPGDHAGPVHPLHVERVRDPGDARLVLPPRRDPPQVPVPELRPLADPGVHRRAHAAASAGSTSRPRSRCWRSWAILALSMIASLAIPKR